jgi:hypothetical protein
MGDVQDAGCRPGPLVSACLFDPEAPKQILCCFKPVSGAGAHIGQWGEILRQRRIPA